MKGEKNEVYDAMKVHGVFATLSAARERALEFLGSLDEWEYDPDQPNSWRNLNNYVEVVPDNVLPTAEAHRTLCRESQYHGHETLNGMSICYHCTPIIWCAQCGSNCKFWLEGAWWCEKCDQKE